MIIFENYDPHNKVNDQPALPPSIDDLKSATTLLTNFIAEKQLGLAPKSDAINEAINISRQAIRHYESYEGDGKKIIDNLRTFIDDASKSSKHMESLLKRKDAYATMKKVEKLFPPKTVATREKTPPIQIPDQKISRRTPKQSISSYSPSDFVLVTCSPSNTVHLQDDSSFIGSPSPKEQFHLYYAFMKPSISWNFDDIQCENNVQLVSDF